MEDDVKVRELRTRMEERFLALYNEMRDRELAFRNEMSEGLRSLRKQLWDKEIRDTKIWAVVITAVVIAVMAKGFHWI
jgi:hypothetical protein